MHESKQETAAKTNFHHLQSTAEQQPEALASQETLSPQQNPLVRGINRVGNIPSASIHATMLNRSTASQNGAFLRQLQRQYGNSYVQRVLALSRKADGDAEAAPEVEEAIQRNRGNGQSLDGKVQAQMESAFGVDFGGVRVHTDAEADTLNRALDARAFTTGQDIFFRQGEYNPNSSSGRELLAHELTHVVQQTGDVRGKLTIGQPGDAYEQEADQIARMVMESEKQAAATPINENSLQRKDEEQENVAQIEDSPVLHKDIGGGLKLKDAIQAVSGDVVQAQGKSGGKQKKGKSKPPTPEGDEGAPGVTVTPTPIAAVSYSAGLRTFQGNIKIWDEDLVFDDVWGTANYMIRCGLATWEVGGKKRGVWLVDSVSAIPVGVESAFKFGPKLEARPMLINGQLNTMMTASLQIAGPKVTDTFNLEMTASMGTSAGVEIGTEAAKATAGVNTQLGATLSAGRTIEKPGAEINMRRGLMLTNYSVISTANLLADRDVDLDPPASVDVDGSGGLFEGDNDIKFSVEGPLFKMQTIR